MCHVEVLEKGRVISKKLVVEGSCRHIYKGNVAKRGSSMTCKDKFNSKRKIDHASNKTHVSDSFHAKIFTWIWKNQSKG
jgi:hypothetical protein